MMLGFEVPRWTKVFWLAITPTFSMVRFKSGILILLGLFLRTKHQDVDQLITAQNIGWS